MNENEMEHRGSKSNKNNLFVKEQRIATVVTRVFGSLIRKNNKIPVLRCVLMGLERDYQVIILSKSFSRCYSTSITSTDTSQNFESKLDPNFVSGFIDGEGSFSVTFIKDKSYKSG